LIRDGVEVLMARPTLMSINPHPHKVSTGARK
jgi:hypothetical protein